MNQMAEERKPEYLSKATIATSFGQFQSNIIKMFVLMISWYSLIWVMWRQTIELRWAI